MAWDHGSPPRSTQPLVYAAECQAVIRQVTRSSLSGNMLIFQASVSGSGRSFLPRTCVYGTRLVSAHPLGANSV